MRRVSSGGNSATSRNVSTWRSGRTSRWTGAWGLTSAIATNPSAARTWSPSRTSLQNRQSSRGPGKDPLLGDALCPHPDELTDRSIDEPRRVIVAVPSTEPVDEHYVLRLLAPPREAQLVRERAQPCAARLLLPRRDAVVVGGDGARPRRVREDVHLRDPGTLDGLEGRRKRGLVLGREADNDVGRQVELVRER